MSASSNKNFVANLYYHGRLEQQQSGDVFESLLTNLHVMLDSLSSGSSGDIIDCSQNKVVYSCSYQSPE